jgi:FkbM family methyltransferase
MTDRVSRPRLYGILKHAICPALRFYYRTFPVKAGKLWLWNSFMRRFILWRPIQIEARTASGLVVCNLLSDLIHHTLYFFGVWEPELTQYLSRQLRPGDVFIDVGANVGVHAMLAAQRVGASGRVHAIEASPTIVAMLRANAARNGLTNLTIHNVAASDRGGTLTVFMHDASNLGRTTTLRGRGDGGPAYVGEETIPALPLPQIVPVEDLLRAKVIKIDVEGAEWEVLQGLATMLPRLRRDVSIVVEADRDALASHGVSVAQFLGFFAAQGFVGERIPGHSAAACIDGPSGERLSIAADFAIAELVFRPGNGRGAT